MWFVENLISSYGSHSPACQPKTVLDESKSAKVKYYVSDLHQSLNILMEINNVEVQTSVFLASWRCSDAILLNKKIAFLLVFLMDWPLRYDIIV